MCGRVGFYDDIGWSKSVLAHYGHCNNLIGELIPSYNIAPSQPLATLLNNGNYDYTHFGLIPHWARDTKFQPINARAETIAEKPTFKSSFKSRRCIIPVNGFYEWMKEGKHKIPYWVSPSSSDFFALAGVYDEWLDPATDQRIISSAIITTTSNDMMKSIHDRMPVILQPDDWALWLDPEVDEPEAVQPLLVPCESDLMQFYEVSTYVNSPVNNDAECIKPMRNALL